MEDRSYNYIVEKFKEYEELKRVHDILHSFGVPYSLTGYFVDRTVNFHEHATSGYNMGETVEVYCCGHEIIKYDHTQEYARSCRWRARHGIIVFNFPTKKSLRDYCRSLKELCDTTSEEEYMKKNKEISDALTSYIDLDMSDISSRKSIIYVI